jgi:hypothetical protein
MMYKGISISPLHGSFAPGYEPPPSDLENLVAGRHREVGDLMHQAVSEHVLRGDKDVAGAPGSQNVLWVKREISLRKGGLMPPDMC